MEVELERYIISGLEHIYLAETMEICWSGFKEGQYFEFVQMLTERLSGILSEEWIRFKAHQKVVCRTVIGKQFCKPYTKFFKSSSIAAAVRSAKEH